MEKNGNEHINFDNLLKLGYAVIDCRFKDYAISPNSMKYVIVRVQDRDSFYQDMLKQFFNVDVKDKDIYELWQKVLEHKIKMSEILGRDVAIRVAALDFFHTEGI